jgi:hypothetical protein
VRLWLSAEAGFAVGGEAPAALIDGAQLKVYPGRAAGHHRHPQGAARRQPARVPERHERKGDR